MNDKFDPDDVRLSMYALGELDEAERGAVEALLANDAEARMFVEELRSAANALECGLRSEAKPALSAEQRGEVELAAQRSTRKLEPIPWVRYALAAGVAVTFICGALAWLKPWKYGVERTDSSERSARTQQVSGEYVAQAAPSSKSEVEAMGYTGGGPTFSGTPPALRFPRLALQPFLSGEPGAQPNPTTGPWPVNESIPSEAQSFYTWRDAGGPVWRYHDVGAKNGDGSEQLRRLRLLEWEWAPTSTESYGTIVDNIFKLTRDDPLSTFSIDVDTASYSNLRRFLRDGQKPPADSVRIEEMINYFDYNYPQPSGAIPFSVTTDVTACPWNTRHQLLRIGLQGRDVMRNERNPSNLVFLIDVSGSMNDARKLPLVVSSLKMLAEELDSRDSIGIVVYAGSSGLVLDSTSMGNRAAVIDALERLQAGGSTNGGEGIQLAYRLAREHFVEGGTNRVILCTDGDFNVGVTSQSALIELIEEQRKSGVFLSVLGFGTGNLKDGTMEQLADKGNGNYAYIDSMREARKVLVDQIGGTLETIAKDVKIQIELNPERAQAWRLVGYENRVLAHKDFNDDTKDAGEIGAGHTVTALYEIVPSGVAFEANGVDSLRYQQAPKLEREPGSDELCFVKLRYKAPDADESRLISQAVRATSTPSERASDDQRFASAVAMFGMKLRNSPHVADVSFADIEKLAASALGRDERGLRIEFVDLVRRAAELH